MCSRMLRVPSLSSLPIAVETLLSGPADLLAYKDVVLEYDLETDAMEIRQIALYGWTSGKLGEQGPRLIAGCWT